MRPPKRPTPYRTAEYRRNRRAAFERDGWTCRVCRRHYTQLPRGKADLTAQHIVPWEAGGTNAVSNLAALCNQCHGRMDGGRRYRR